MISNDELRGWDPDIKKVEVTNCDIHITLHPDSSVLTFTRDELERLIKEIDNG